MYCVVHGTHAKTGRVTRGSDRSEGSSAVGGLGWGIPKIGSIGMLAARRQC